MPSSILTPARATLSNPPDKDAPFCGICRRQFSRYTCPRCNLLYCSLPCFRAETHSQCSEPFYRDQLASDIHAEPSTFSAERKAMMDLLKRFEEDSLDDPFANPENNDDEGGSDGDDLERRLAGLDLGSASADQIWAVLTPEERARFTRVVQDPTSELAKTLLASPDISSEMLTPWWVASSSTPQAHVPASRPARPPDVMAIPEPLLAAPTPSSPALAFPLAYNLVAILVAYAYASRHLSAYPLPSSPDARIVVSRLVPFLIARDDKTRFPGIESAATDIYSRFDAGAMTPAAFVLLLRDAATLLRPPPLVTENNVEPVPAALRALSDLHAVFKPRDPRTAAKVVFYAAQVRRASAAILRGLGADAERWAARLEKEGEEGDGDGERPLGSEIASEAVERQERVDRHPPDSLTRGAQKTPLIVEIS